MRILILGAFKDELIDILGFYKELNPKIIAKRQCLTAVHKDQELIFSYTGIGTIMASSTTTALSEALDPDLIIMCGVGGGLNPALKVGDLVVGNKIIDLDLCYLSSQLINTPYESCLTDPHTCNSFENEHEIDSLILQYISSLSINGLSIGTIVTSNTFPIPRMNELNYNSYYAIDMETAGVCKAAQYYDIQVLAVRAISNLINSSGVDFGTDSNSLSICSKKLALFINLFLKNISSLEFIAKQKQKKRILEIIEKYDLQIHPEGGWYRRTFASSDIVTLEGQAALRYSNESRAAGTSIIYLLSSETYSAWHTVQSDETWNFHAGDPLLLRTINPDTAVLEEILLSFNTGLLQYTVKAGYIFSAETLGRFSLTGCTVTPGFDYKDFKLLSKDEFIKKCPQHANLLRLVSAQKNRT